MMDDKMVMDDDSGSMNGMATSFLPWATYKGTILFDFWKVETQWEFALTWFAIVGLAVIYHAIRFLIYTLEEYMYKPLSASSTTTTATAASSSNSSSASGGASARDQEGYQQLPDDKDAETPLAPDQPRGPPAPMQTMEAAAPSHYMLLRALHALASGFNYGVALLLMLVAMTYNPSLFLALMFGYALGDFIFFSWTRPASVAQDCH